MNISCPHCAARLTIDEKIVAASGGGPCPACGRILAIKVPPPNLSPVFSPTHPASTTLQSKQGLVIGSILGTGAVVVLIAVLVTANSFGSTTTSFRVWDEQLERLKREIEQKEQELKETEGNLREATQSLHKLEDDQHSLQRACEEQNDQLQNLIMRLDAIDQWKQAEVVMVNPHSFSVGMQKLDDGSFRLISKAKGQFQQDAVSWAKKAGKPVIDKDPELTRKIYAAVDLGEVVPESLSQEINRYWSPLRFVPVSPEEKNPPFIVFEPAERGGRHVAFFLGNDTKSIQIRGVASENDSIPRSRVQVGTVRLAQGEKILSHLSDGEFLDYCVLKAAQNLGSRDGRAAIARVAVHVEVEALKEFLKLSKQADTRPTDELFEFWARLHEKPYPRDSRKEPVRILRELAMYVEDEVYDKLTRLGIPVLERQQIQAVIDESNFGGPLSSSMQQEITQLGATHLLFVDVKKSQAGGRYHLATRLTEIRHGEVLWAQSGEQLEPLPNVQQRFLLRTGKLALVTVKPEAQKSFQGVEQPPVAVPATLGVKARLTHLVVIEDDNDDSLLYRPLFGVEPAEISRKEISKLTWISEDTEVPTAHQLRYIVWKLASAMLPAAGRVAKIHGDNAQITLGLRHGIKHHDTLYVLRKNPQFAGDSPTTPTLLATTLNVTEIHDGASRVVISGSNVPGWENDEALQPDDIVITKAGRPVSVAMLAPGWQPPKPDAIQRMGLSNSVQLERSNQSSVRMSLDLKQAIGDGLRAAGVPVFTEFDEKSILATGATHIFGGVIRPTNISCYHLDAMVFPLTAQNVGLLIHRKAEVPRLGEELVRVNTDINLSTLK